MGDLDAKAKDASARRYVMLRRSYFVAFLSSVVAWVVLWVTYYASPIRSNHYLVNILIPMMVIGFIMSWIINAFTWFALWRFRCPRCGEQFIRGTFSTWPGAHCKHCGLCLAGVKEGTSVKR